MSVPLARVGNPWGNRPARILAVIATFLAAGSSCRQEQSVGHKAVVVLVDRSASTGADRDLYRRGIARILESLRSGDRIVGGWITGASAADFREYLDEELPPPLPPIGVLDTASKYKARKESWERKTEEQKTKIREDLERLLDKPSAAARTEIFESLRIVGQLLAPEPRPTKLLVLMCDMVEDSALANFETMRLDDAFIEKEIARQQEQRILPALRGVRVYVVGARGEPLERAAMMEQFLRQYFAAAGAEVTPGAYSRALPSFGE
jgi:hypothetical protein